MPDTVIRRVLAVGAHPDDVEISCGGTLARYANGGAEVTVVTVMNGDKGTWDLPPEEISEIRRKECMASAAVIGAQWIGLGHSDGTLVWDKELHVKLIQTFQQVDPDIIVTHAPDDYMSDHTETARAVTNASCYTVCPQFCAHGGKPGSKVPPVYFMDTVCGVGFAPQEYVDITDTLETKLAMYAKHVSQHKYLAEREGQDFFEVIRTVARYRGLQCGAGYAEAFCRYEVWPRIACARHLP